MKHTRKYIAGYVALSHMVKPSLLHYYGTTNERLYTELSNRGLAWDSGAGDWLPVERHILGDTNDSHPGNGIVRIRVMADRAEINDAALRVIQGCMGEDMVIISQSENYGSRRHGWSRTYITARMKP